MPSTPTIRFMLMLCCLAFFHCANTSKLIIAVIKPQMVTELSAEQVTATIALTQNNLMLNKLTIENNGQSAVWTDPKSVVLKIEGTCIEFYAVDDYAAYVNMRLAAAKEMCSESENSSPSCVQEVERFFQTARNAKAFEFGVIKPGEMRTGNIAFDLPDPFNASQESRELADYLKNYTAPLNGQLVVMAVKRTNNLIFSFPVSIVTFVESSTDIPLIKLMAKYLKR